MNRIENNSAALETLVGLSEIDSLVKYKTGLIDEKLYNYNLTQEQKEKLSKEALMAERFLNSKMKELQPLSSKSNSKL